MRLKRLKLENFRGFEKIVIDFEDDLNVFIGKNGSGKTSILDAIAFNLEHITKRLNTEKDSFTKNYWPRKQDLKLGKEIGNIVFEIESDNNRYVQEFTLKKDGSHSYLNHENIDESKKIDAFIDKTKNHFYENLPVLLQIKSNRNKIDKSNRETTYIDRLECYSNAFSFNNVHFSDFASWFEKHENHENAEIRRLGDLNFKLPSLQSVRGSIISFFKNFDNSDIQTLSINREKELKSGFKKNIDLPQLIIQKGDNLFNLDQLSDGEQSLIIIVADIARRAFLAAPSLGSKACGIVLIDEIELHLHPSWQRKIIQALTNTFPNIQFIIATHSPQILSSVEKSESIIYLKEFSQYSIRKTFGKDSNTILEEMGVEEGPNSKEIRQLYRFIDDQNIREAKRLQKKLEKLIEPDYGHLIKSRLFIERMDNE